MALTLRLDILPPAQRALWDELGDTPPHFTLYGGTALALRLGHRVSVDFDFFALEPIDPHRLLANIPYLRQATVLQVEPNTLTCQVMRPDPVKVSFFGLPNLSRLDPPDHLDAPALLLAGIRDIAGTKALAIQSRNAAKDYLDMDALLTAGGLTLRQVLDAGAAVFGPQYQPLATLKALTYFDDVADVPHDVRHRLRQAATTVTGGFVA